MNADNQAESITSSLSSNLNTLFDIRALGHSVLALLETELDDDGQTDVHRLVRMMRDHSCHAVDQINAIEKSLIKQKGGAA